MGEFIINKVTHNSIFVTWQIPVRSAQNAVLKSPSFTLVVDGYPISFSLSLPPYPLGILTIEKKGPEIGRGIAFFAISHQTGGIIMRMYLNEAWKQSFSQDDVMALAMDLTDLKIDCKITWLGFIDDIPRPIHPLPIEDVPFDNTAIPDFTLIVEGQEIPSHKAILARHSPIFSTMFGQPMKESKENKMTIEDIEYSTMKILLKIICTGKTEDLREINAVFKVFQAAVKYQMSAVKDLCEYKLQQQIQVDNVLMLLAEADKYDAPLLCETCVAYILAAQDDKLTEEFKKISEKPKIKLAVMNIFMEQLFLTSS